MSVQPTKFPFRRMSKNKKCLKICKYIKKLNNKGVHNFILQLLRKTHLPENYYKTI